MPRSPEPVGVCVLRITRGPAGLVVDVTSRLDVEAGSGESRATVTGLDQGVAVVRRFLEDFRQGDASGPPARPDHWPDPPAR